ncbi:ATP-binding protein [Bacillus sp. KH172YL63]|uniref:ATP-binding protein n=1 Tax=Bacillus sp. KH172YL63 TaxID=2709784 RepID=UPI0013E494DA|nr:ATP-binding protein [Bacillus sp. KH172YL63]BCB05716.1 hypothetical protein KH172YL63_38490 [Bacillus sp. KH172YL63]
MRRLFKNVFKDTSLDDQQPALPPDMTYKDLQYRTKRGFLAKKLTEYAGMGAMEGDDLFYRSISMDSEAERNGEYGFFLEISEQMLEWADEGSDLREEIHRLTIRPEIQNAMLKAYEMFKEELFSERKSSEPVENALSLEDEKWKVYRDVILASTQGKLLLLLEKELTGYKQGRILAEGTIHIFSDIPRCRKLAQQTLEEMGYSNASIMSWLLVLSEAITNTIKHGEEGKMTLIEDEDQNEIRFMIEDKGPGFPLEDLPKATLLAGYSTKKSLGQGFTLMMKISKQVCLYSSTKGSTIILSFNREGHKGKINQTG